MTLLHRPRSGDVVRTGRRHDLPAGPANADCILIMGSNMAEAHPVGFQWVMEARERGAEVIHVDPRFTRTSAIANRYVRCRAGSDIAFLGGIINYILEHGREFREYVDSVHERARDHRRGLPRHRGSRRLLLRLGRRGGGYDTTSWQYDGHGGALRPAASASSARRRASRPGTAGRARRSSDGEPPRGGPDARSTRAASSSCSSATSRRYTPELVERDLRRAARASSSRSAEALCANSGRERTSAIVYSVGWTQHTVGVQNIRAAAIIQLLLGNIGRPGGGIMALRGHASIQGSTDIPTLYNILPGYIPMPHAERARDLAEFIELTPSPAGFWGHMGAYAVSLLKAWWGDAATADNDFCFDYLPRINGDHSALPDGARHARRQGAGLLRPRARTRRSARRTARLHRRALAKLDVARRPRSRRDRDRVVLVRRARDRDGELRTERHRRPRSSSCPPRRTSRRTARSPTPSACCSGTTRRSSREGDCRSELWFFYHLGRLVREKLAAGSHRRPRPAAARPHLGLPDARARTTSRRAEAVLREINGCGADGQPLSAYTELKDDGSTTLRLLDLLRLLRRRGQPGARGAEPARADLGRARVGLGLAREPPHPLQPGLGRPDGRPWSERKRYVWWDAEQETLDGRRRPRLRAGQAPGLRAARRAPRPRTRSPASTRSSCRPTAAAGCSRPAGLVDGPLPDALRAARVAVREPALRAAGQSRTPALRAGREPLQPERQGEPGSDAYPYVMTTYRLTEHHTAGGMSRTARRTWPSCSRRCSARSARSSPPSAGSSTAGWATIVTARGGDRGARPGHRAHAAARGRRAGSCTRSACPTTGARRGLVTGDSANDLFPLVLDPNVHIQESKAATCDIRRRDALARGGR